MTMGRHCCLQLLTMESLEGRRKKVRDEVALGYSMLCFWHTCVHHIAFHSTEIQLVFHRIFIFNDKEFSRLHIVIPWHRWIDDGNICQFFSPSSPVMSWKDESQSVAPIEESWSWWHRRNGREKTGWDRIAHLDFPVSCSFLLRKWMFPNQTKETERGGRRRQEEEEVVEGSVGDW